MRSQILLVTLILFSCIGLIQQDEPPDELMNPLTFQNSSTERVSKRYISHEPIQVEHDQDFEAVAIAGNGSGSNPYILAGWEISGSTTWGTALRDAGKQPGEVIVISMDYSEQNLDWVSEGWVYALVGQPLYEECYRAVELLIDVLHGKEIEFANPYPAPLITADEVDTYYAYGERVRSRWKD